MNLLHQQDNISDMAAKATLPVTVSGMTLWGVPIPEIVQILTAVYVAVLVADKIFGIYLRYKYRNDEPKE